MLRPLLRPLRSLVDTHLVSWRLICDSAQLTFFVFYTNILNWSYFWPIVLNWYNERINLKFIDCQKFTFIWNSDTLSHQTMKQITFVFQGHKKVLIRARSKIAIFIWHYTLPMAMKGGRELDPWVKACTQYMQDIRKYNELWWNVICPS